MTDDIFFGLIFATTFALAIIGLWRVFTKAGQLGWAAIVPVYNLYVLLRVAGNLPGWLLVLFIIPYLNIVMMIIVGILVAERFGKGAIFGAGLGLLPFIFYPILGFGRATYTPLLPVESSLVKNTG